MSFSEIIIILIAAIILLKPSDLPILIKQVKKIRSFFSKTKGEILSAVNLDLEKEVLSSDAELEQINYYLEKINHIGVEYKGDYDINLIKQFYQNLINAKSDNS